MNSHLIKPVVATIALTAAVAASPALASGVPAGTSIQNTATATYNSGSATNTVTSNTVAVTVDQLIDVAVAGLNSAPVPASSSPAVLTYSVTNTGNGPSTFTLAADPNVSGNSYNGTIQQVVIDSNNNGVYDPGTDTVYTTGSATPLINADGSIKVFVLVGLPASGATDNTTSQVKLTATSSIGNGTPGTLVSHGGVGGVDAVVGSSTGVASGQDAIIASLAAVTLIKSAVIADPFGGTTPVPGAVVTYTIASHVTGSGTANGLHITDVIPTGTTYQAGTLKLGAAVLTDSADTDAGQASQASGVDVNLGNVAGGSADQSISFKVKIN
ncbi:MAG: DUF11 domain-containing protein [Proteobacteria bacterium]|nr:DUF11 domain-containing protein [Pseudomonadota bacterium]